jgi:hypothetical protein
MKYNNNNNYYYYYYYYYYYGMTATFRALASLVFLLPPLDFPV